ncbi:MAG: FAD-dependent oxidoreductase [Gammaproteobacteria bacterium]|nr:FAD-dependent oxidoreductase [Gammaproteobacteria bacterium]
MNKSRRVAVVGSGISGAASAWLLRDACDVSLFEQEARFGGHTHTVSVDEGDRSLRIDTGFMVYNRPNYPLLSALFDHLSVASYPTDMSFAASFDGGRLEYAGTDLNGLFGQRRNLLQRDFWRLLSDILRFNRVAGQALRSPPADDECLADFLDRHAFGDGFRQHYLYPMAAAIWSSPSARIAHFPALSFLRFFANHGLIRLADRPQWLTVEGGSRAYLDRLLDDLGGRARVAARVVSVERRREGATLVFADGQRAQFDDVILACHSDQALALLASPTAEERDVVGAISYQPNRVLLHTDPALMPKQRRVWSSWNYLREGTSADDPVSVTYWMNSLQRLATRRDYFVSLNPVREPAAASIVGEYHYEHPVFDAGALRAQRQLHRIQGRERTWFAGAWTGYGFHEDGMRSAVEVAAALGARVPWLEQAKSSRALSMIPTLAGQPA